MFKALEQIRHRPKPFEFYTALELWTDEYTAQRMLECHLDDGVDLSSRRGEFIDASVEWISTHFRVGEGTRIADFGCGPGLYASRLARRGARVVGIDFSENSIRFAREAARAEGLGIDYVARDYLDFETDARFDLIVMIMCDFCALSPEQRSRLLKKFHRLLEPGGAVLLDVNSLVRFDQREETITYGANLLDGFWSADPYYGFLNTFKYDSEHVVLDKFTIIEPTRTRTVYNWFQHFSPETLEREFRECGFVIDGQFTDVAGAPFDAHSPEFAVVAKRSKQPSATSST